MLLPSSGLVAAGDRMGHGAMGQYTGIKCNDVKECVNNGIDCHSKFCSLTSYLMPIRAIIASKCCGSAVSCLVVYTAAEQLLNLLLI